MKHRTISLIASIALFALMSMSATRIVPRAQAQFPGFFGATRFPALDVDKSDNLYLMMSVATKDASAGTPGSQIFFAMSNNGGMNWDNFPQTRNLSKSNGEAFGPSLAVTKSGKTRVYVVYHDNSNKTTQAYLIRSKKGTKFKKPANITPHDEGAFSPRVALDSEGAVNITWGDTQEGGKQVMFIRSTDDGASFSDPINISKSKGEAFEPEIAVDSTDAINLVWEDTASGVSEIMFSRSTDGGETFSAPVNVSKGAGPAIEPHIAADGSGGLHVVWSEGSGGGFQAFYSRSTDAGETFSDPVNVSNQTDGDIHKLVVTTFKDTVYVAYNDQTRGNKQVFLVKSSDAGISFSNPVQVSRADNSVFGGRAHSPAMAVDSSGRLHIVWIDSSIVGNDEGILFYSNTTNGRSFSAQKMILAIVS